MKSSGDIHQDYSSLRAGDLNQYSQPVTDGPAVVGIGAPLPVQPADHHEPLAPGATPTVPRSMARPHRR